MIKIAPSLLAADFCNMEQGVRMMERAGADYLHCDIMDGVFVPNISFGFQMISRLNEITDIPLDVHLMIVQPERYIERFAEAGSDLITVHAEATDHLQRVLKQISQCGKKPGVVLNPATPLEVRQSRIWRTSLYSCSAGKGSRPAQNDRRFRKKDRYRSGWGSRSQQLYAAARSRSNGTRSRECSV